ncbi:DUF1287 domain-containing protein [Carboxydothermus islandicus]|uniref:DUF1287 domain-containing protein n=1 Tax=Carboxydothermus islandicus TaxID=661089 RepID=A0A1L8CZE5_9THEO|nr:DUF1287 domain-containing protein [Carboxydothermus islandicus]GAV24290.1 DUF1287 domain-containing protein [Carboxydothermus islandicus]
MGPKLKGILLLIVLGLGILSFIYRDGAIYKYLYLTVKAQFSPRVRVEKVILKHDQDGDGIYDLDDIVQGARKDVANKPRYRSAYYAGGYPPDNEGVCTDVIWRAFKNAGYNLKAMVDEDIKNNLEAYPRVGGKPDPNIDFRRVPNLDVFFRRHAQILTTKLIPGDPENLKEWQGGDIVVFKNPQHIAIISDKRRRDGVPYIIHNAGPYTREADELLLWLPGIVGHYRFPRVKS